MDGGVCEEEVEGGWGGLEECRVGSGGVGCGRGKRGVSV